VVRISVLPMPRRAIQEVSRAILRVESLTSYCFAMR